MSLGAIDFGLIVDGAVIIVEAVMHQLTHSKHFRLAAQITQKEMDEEVQHSSSRIMNSAVFGQIIILIVYLPILSLSGIEGKMFKPMAQTVSFAILGAFILSLTYVYNPTHPEINPIQEEYQLGFLPLFYYKIDF